MREEEGSMDFEVKKIKTKILIVGGGTAGCYATLSISRKEKVDVVIAEKANIFSINFDISPASGDILSVFILENNQPHFL